MTETTNETPTEETVDAVTAAGVKPDEPTDKPTTEDDSKGDLEAWRAISRKWEDRAKANLAELEQVKAERARDLEKITSLEADLADMQALRETNTALLRETVAAVKGVPAHRITGSTREELEADADKFLEELNNAPMRGYVPTSGQGGDQPVVSVMTGRERAREALGKS